MANILIQVRRKSDGYYSSGRTPSPLGTVRFTKHGKAWTSKGAFHGHLTLILNPQTYRPEGHDPYEVYLDCEVITVDVLKKTVDVIDFDMYYKQIEKNKPLHSAGL